LDLRFDLKFGLWHLRNKTMLYQKIKEDLNEALKSGDTLRISVLRMVLSSLHNKEIEKKGKNQSPELTEEEIIEVLKREAKKRKEAIETYLKGNRNDLADKEKKELEIIIAYLPKQLSEEEIKKIVQEAIQKLGAQSKKDFGKVMGFLMKELKGKADAGLVSQIVKESLQ